MQKCPFITFLLALGLCTAGAAPSLKIGDPAPPIKAAKWFKGEPVTAFDSNCVYVVEFWATWCGPCRKSIPHLTELAKKHQGKARILGFSIWETEKSDHEKRLASVGKFVSEMGDKMDYLIAADDNSGFMAREWMEAAGENGIPTAFIVGKDGKISWIGNPWAGMDEILDQVIAGKLDTRAVLAAADERQKAKDSRAQIRDWLKGVTELQEAKKFPEAVIELDKAVQLHPELDGKVGFLRYKLLLGYDEAAAYRQARLLLDGELKNNPSSLYGIARDLTDPPGRKSNDWDLAFDISRRLCELSHSKNPSHLSVLAESYFGKGNIAKAIETAELAVKQAEADPEYPDSSTKYLQRRLAKFKAAQSPAP
jgi:thiol-disulfide isomerase/thioredoxin